MNSTPLTSLLRNTGIASCAALLFSFLMIGQVTSHASSSAVPIPAYMDMSGKTTDLFGTTQYFDLLKLNDHNVTDGTIYLLGTKDENYTGMIYCYNSDFAQDQTSTNISHVNISAQISGGGILVVSTNCSTTLSGNTNQPNNDFIGGTMIDTAELILANGATLGNASNLLMLTNGARLDLGGSTQIINGLSMSSDATIVNGSIIDQATGNSTTTYPAAN